MNSPPHPELDKLDAAAGDFSAVANFLDWLDASGDCRLLRVNRHHHMHPDLEHIPECYRQDPGCPALGQPGHGVSPHFRFVPLTTDELQQLICEYLDIDRDRVNRERNELHRWLAEQAQPKDRTP